MTAIYVMIGGISVLLGIVLCTYLIEPEIKAFFTNLFRTIKALATFSKNSDYITGGVTDATDVTDQQIEYQFEHNFGIV